MGTANHTPGEVRYFTYYIVFPGGKHDDYWVDQIPFVHDLQFELARTAWRDDHQKCRDLLHKGETHWKDQNGVEHRIVIESKWRARKWGKPMKR